MVRGGQTSLFSLLGSCSRGWDHEVTTGDGTMEIEGWIGLTSDIYSSTKLERKTLDIHDSAAIGPNPRVSDDVGVGKKIMSCRQHLWLLSGSPLVSR